MATESRGADLGPWLPRGLSGMVTDASREEALVGGSGGSSPAVCGQLAPWATRQVHLHLSLYLLHVLTRSQGRQPGPAYGGTLTNK